jgi:biotin carboxyl carrier protein
VSAIQVATGDKVEKGQTLMLLEAMKMEIRIKSPEGGLVKRLLVANGQAVDKDQMLVEIGE